ncbi:MAG: hypothetical protein Q8P67_02440 [archaeon]|nr:hypothetical protein [archaeon]
MAARSDSSSEEFNSFEESEEGEESDDWEVPDHAPIRTDSCPNASFLAPLPHQPAEPFLQFLSVTFPQEQQPLASELSFSLLFRSLDLKRTPALLNAAIWFVGCPESRTTEHDQLLDEIEFGPFCAFGDSADFSIAFSCPGPDLSRIPDISTLDVTCILIRVSCSGAPALLIPFVVSVDSRLLLRQLFRARPCFDSRSPITSELHPSRIHPPPPVKTTSHPGPVLVSPTVFPYAPPSSLLPTATTPASSSSSFLDSTADSFFSFGDPLVEPFGALQLNCDSPFPPSNAVAICAIQIDSVDCTSVEQRDQNLRHACDIIRLAHQQRASQEEVALYLLPELSSTGYRSDTFLNLDILAEADRGPSYQMFSSLASSLCCYISYGFPRKIDDGVSICHAIINVRSLSQGFLLLSLLSLSHLSSLAFQISDSL